MHLKKKEKENLFVHGVVRHVQVASDGGQVVFFAETQTHIVVVVVRERRVMRQRKG